MYGKQFLGNCLPAKSWSVPPATLQMQICLVHHGLQRRIAHTQSAGNADHGLFHWFDLIVLSEPLSHPAQPCLPASVSTAATAHSVSLSTSLAYTNNIHIIYIACICYLNVLCIQSKFLWYTLYMHFICIA